MKREIAYVGPEKLPKPRYSFEFGGYGGETRVRFEANTNMTTTARNPLQSGYFFDVVQDSKSVYFTMSDEEMQLLFLAYQESRQWMIEQSR